MNRYAWTWLAIAVIVVGTAVALWRQQANFNEHKGLAENTCAVVRNNVDLIQLFVGTEENAHDDRPADERAALDRALARTRRLAARLHC